MRVLIVEDEAIIREGLLSMIDWKQEGFSECIGCESAVDALEILEEKGAELVITDIFMPVLSGLEMIEMANQMGVHASFVILTGHERFEYAQKAVELGARRFLIKPISPRELLPMVREVLGELREKDKTEHYLAETEERLREYTAILRQKFWSDLMREDPPPPEEIQRQARLYGIPVDFPCFQCAALLPVRREGAVDLSHRVALRQIARGILEDSLLYIYDMGELDVLAVRGAMDDDRIRVLFTAMEANLPIQVRLGVGRACESLSMLHGAAEDAMEAAKSIRHASDSHVAYYEDLLRIKNRHIAYPRQLEAKVFEMLRFHETFDDTVVNDFLDAVFAVGATDEQASLMLLRFQVALYRFAEEYGLSDMPPFGAPQSKAEGRQAAGERLLHLVHLMAHQKASSQQRAMVGLVEQAKRVIDEGYGDAELNVASVARRLYISSGYLSRLFRSVTGETCMGYLTKVRMRTAQKLLANSSVKSYEVAQMVGYNNPNYFSALFKKHAGMSPRQYRTEKET